MKMNDEQVLAFIEQLYPYFIKKYKEDNSYTQTAKLIDAEVVEIIATNKSKARVRLNPYDKDTIIVNIKTNEVISIGDSVQLLYKDSLKNASIIMKN
jgi:hypothetical protein